MCVSVTNIASSFLFLGGIEPFLGHPFSMTKTTKLFSSMFDLGTQSLLPRICTCTKSPISACMADTPEMFGPTRGFLGLCKMLWGLPLLPWQ